MFNLFGQKAIVTGGSKGLGFTLSKQLAQLGSSVTLVARNESLLKEKIQELPILKSCQSHQYVPMDLSHEDYNKLTPYFNECSMLINCAGVTNHNLLSKISNEEIISTINLNLITPIMLSKLIMKPMMLTASRLKKNPLTDSIKIPLIVNISSVLGLSEYTVPGTSVYSASKAGLNGFTHSLSKELRGKIRVNSILPSLISDTDMGQNANVSIDCISKETVVQEVIKVIKDESINGESIVVR